MDRHLADRLAIRDVIETWVIARDSGDWETFRGTWQDDGYIMATWWQGPAEEFTEVTRAGWERGVNIMHFLGGCRVTVAGDRAIAQTKMTIMQRGVVHGVRCDVACMGRFYDFFERRRQPAEQRAARPAEQRAARPAEQRAARPAESSVPPGLLTGPAASLARAAGPSRCASRSTRKTASIPLTPPPRSTSILTY
jgi:hypothetical protein